MYSFSKIMTLQMLEFSINFKILHHYDQECISKPNGLQQSCSILDGSFKMQHIYDRIYIYLMIYNYIDNVGNILTLTLSVILDL